MSDAVADERRAGREDLRVRATEGTPLIQIEQVSRRYPTGVEALRGVSLVAHEGEVVCIIGPSGSGKSTLLRCVNGLEPTTDGRILFDGRVVGVKGRQAREIRRQIGMVFQSFELFPHMTALANVAEGPRTVLRLPRGEVPRSGRARCWTRWGLPTRRRSLPAQLSGGQQQRVAIARALAMQPRAMLFDEATSALDPEMVGEVLAVMQGARAGGHDHAGGHPRNGLRARRGGLGGGHGGGAGCWRKVRPRASSASRDWRARREFLRRVTHEPAGDLEKHR